MLCKYLLHLIVLTRKSQYMISTDATFSQIILNLRLVEFTEEELANTQS